jgi:hypothetical protein
MSDAPQCRCIRFVPGQPCCRETREPQSEGAAISDLIRQHGCYAYTNAEGDRVWFKPTGKLPVHIGTWLAADYSRRLMVLRDYLLEM